MELKGPQERLGAPNGSSKQNQNSAAVRVWSTTAASQAVRAAGLGLCLGPPQSSVATDVTMPFIEPLSDANLEHLALEQIVPALLSHGFYYVDGLLGDLAGGAVLDQVKEMHRSGKLQDGRLAGSAPGIHRRSIRGDKIAWVSGSERGCEAVSFLLNLMDKLVSVCARRLGGRTIGERSQVRPRTPGQSHLTCRGFVCVIEGFYKIPKNVHEAGAVGSRTSGSVGRSDFFAMSFSKSVEDY